MPHRRMPAAIPQRLVDRPLLLDHPTAWRLSKLAWALSAFLFVGLLIAPVRDLIDLIDESIHRVVVDAEWQPLVVASDALDIIGSAWVTMPFIGGIALWLAFKRHWEALLTWLITMGLTQLAIGPVKNLYSRARPPASLVETTSFSFPSGHSVVGAAIAVAAVIVLVPAGPRRRNLEVLAAAFAILMALSRVYLRAHWMSDVAAGGALGVAIAVGTAAALHEIDARRRHRRGEAAEP